MAGNLRRLRLVAMLVLCVGLASTSARAADEVPGAAKEKQEHRLPDAWISTKVKASILAVSVNDGLRIHVKTTDGNVKLEGTLRSQAALERCRQAALRIFGVRSLDTTAVAIDADAKP